MARSLWKRTLVTTFAWAGLAWAQQSPAPAPQVAKTAAVITLQEPGKPAQKCTVIKTWKTPDGATAHQVQALDTGEMMTIVEGGQMTSIKGYGDDSKVRGKATRIFHWGRDRVSPAGAPKPPEVIEAVAPKSSLVGTTSKPVVTQPAMKELPKPLIATRQELPKPTVVVKQEASKPVVSKLVIMPVVQEESKPITTSKPAVTQLPPVSIESKPVAKPVVAQKAPEPAAASASAPMNSYIMKDQSRSFAEAWRKPAFPNKPILVQETVTVMPVGQQAPMKGETVVQPMMQPGKVVSSKPMMGASTSQTVVVQPMMQQGQMVSAKPMMAPSAPAPDAKSYGNLVTVESSPTEDKTPAVSSKAMSEAPRKLTSELPSMQLPQYMAQPAKEVPGKPVSMSKETPSVTVTPAAPTDWRQSWGKADDHKSQLPAVKELPAKVVSREVRKPVETPAPAPLVGATAKPIESAAPADPLQTPTRYATPTGEAQNMWTAPGGQSLANQASRVTVRDVLKEKKQIRQAEEAHGRAEMSSTPIPIPELPDVRRAPTPPMSAPSAPMPFGPAPMAMAPANRAMGWTQTTTMNPETVNAFASMPSQEVVTKSTNAFTGMEDLAQTPPSGMQAQSMIPPPPPALVTQMMQMPPAAQQAMMQQYIMQQQAILMQQQQAQMMQQRGMMPQQGMMMPQQGMPMAQPRMMPDVQPTMKMLKEAMLPSQREAAAESLCKVDWKTCPQVVDALMMAAKEDPAATVRASCIRCLVKMQVNTPAVLAMMHGLRCDRDAVVCREADQALMGLSTIQPTGAVMPRR